MTRPDTISPPPEVSDEMIHFGTCDKCGTSGQFVPDSNRPNGYRIRSHDLVFQDDIRAIMDALGLQPTGLHSPHETVHAQIIPFIRSAIDTAQEKK